MTLTTTSTTAPEGIARRATWPAVALAVFASAWGGNEFTPLLVMYRQSGEFSAVAVDALLFLYVLGIVPALLIGGPLSDRLGRRPLMLPAPIFAALGSLLLAFGAHSIALLSVGRVFSGVALGLSMAVGGSWITELSVRAGDRAAAGARRGAMSLTAGFGVGAGVAGALAQWAPWPHVLAYAVNIAIAAIAVLLILRVPETRERQQNPGRLVDDLKIPSAGHRRFLLVVLPVAPWVFGACATAYAVIPALMSVRTSGAPIAFAALCCVLGLAAGFGIQSVGRRIDDPDGVRGVVSALVVLAIGMGLAALAAHVLTIWLSLVAATVLGCGYGMAMIAGLLEVQRISGPEDLAGLSAVFYGVTYLGFAVPAVLAWLSQTFGALTYPEIFLFGVGAALVCLAIVGVGHRMHRPDLDDRAAGDQAGDAGSTP
ncbi:MFS transporter [Gordonia polyisoprenivorans]|uniref:MFS transporter n=1 Tax=Gordonia polyisoprenivorans TaxID=84595 RepID=UPI000377E64C|nr:MFS transporter [Gordonia polyisoprenivorans]MBE7195083.1 MFS transporter [Gordonia polyisoprenivorans]QUD82030.1 MFS transporter [Gordonia polyisoprenivorans]